MRIPKWSPKPPNEEDIKDVPRERAPRRQFVKPIPIRGALTVEDKRWLQHEEAEAQAWQKEGRT